MFCRLKDYRPIATGYEKPATSVLDAIHVLAAVTWRLSVLTPNNQTGQIDDNRSG
jgi:hypothetical protein